MRLSRKIIPRLILFFIFLPGFPVKSWALTAAQIITEARTYLGDQSNSPTRQQFTDSTLLSFLNDGQREANAINWLMTSTYTFTLSGGTTEYALPSDFMATQRVIYKNQKLDQTSFNDLDSNQTGWIGVSTGTPIKYYLDYFVNPTAIGFFPSPSIASTNTITVYYVQQPAELTSTTQIPWNAWPLLTPYHSSLAYYIAMRGFQAQEEYDSMASFQNEWLLALQYMRQGLYKQPDFNPGFAGRRNQ